MLILVYTGQNAKLSESHAELKHIENRDIYGSLLLGGLS